MYKGLWDEFQDGNGRTGRWIEKRLLIEKIGQKAASIQLEKNYFIKLKDYYSKIKKLGLEYEDLDYGKSLDSLLMNVKNASAKAAPGTEKIKKSAWNKKTFALHDIINYQ